MSGVVPIQEGDHETTRLVDLFDRNVRRLADVAGRLERLSNESLDAMPMSTIATVHLGAVVGEVVKNFRDMARARDVALHFSPDLPAVHADPARIEVIFSNLIDNAIKFSDPGKPSRLVEIVNVPGHPQPTVVVRDNGIGIPARRAQHLFREFTRAHTHRAGDLRGEGLGLGLSIVRDSMDACGGTVLLQSTDGGGTAVTLSWPRTRESTTPAAR
jgi:signal transduction histidine kinase